jgi:hypothetical protein
MFPINVVPKLGALVFANHGAAVMKKVCEDDMQHVLQYLMTCNIPYSSMVREILDEKPNIGPFCREIMVMDYHFMAPMYIINDMSDNKFGRLSIERRNKYCENVVYLLNQRLFMPFDTIQYLICANELSMNEMILSIAKAYNVKLQEQRYVETCIKYHNKSLLWSIIKSSEPVISSEIVLRYRRVFE